MGRPAAGLTSQNTTFVVLNGSTSWRAAICIVMGCVITSAGVASQRLGATSQDIHHSDNRDNTLAGATRPSAVTTLALPDDAVIGQLLVSVGDHVRAGQVLLTLNNQQPRRLVEQLRFDVERARNRTIELEHIIGVLDQSISVLAAASSQATSEAAAAQQNAQGAPERQQKDSPERAQALYDEAVAHERKVAELAMTGVAAMQDLEQAQIAVRGAADDLANAHRGARAAAMLASAEALRAKMQADVALGDQQRLRQERLAQLADARLKQSETESAMARVIAELGDLTVRATTDGLVTELTVKPGDRAPGGRPLVNIATVNPMVVDLDVPPNMVSAMTRDESVIVHLVDSGHEYPASIRTIAPLPGKTGSHAVEVAFENPTEELVSGRPAVVRFVSH